MNKFEVLCVIGQGQYGTAHKARSREDGQLYCLKRIPMTAKDDHKGALREAQLLSTLDHPNIIAYKDSFLDQDGALCIVTTFCDEGDMFSRIKARAAAGQYFSESEIMDYFIQIASALMYIHGRKILHRDLKTQNIFLAKGGIVMLGDFGISKVLEKTDAFATTVTGTPYYMAPEICTNQPYTFKSDIWSLGCVLYELCTLKHAFAADSLLSLVYQIVRGTFPPIPADVFSQQLNELVCTMLTREAADRPGLQQVFAMPYVQAHMRRFNADERRRLLQKQSSLACSRKLKTLESKVATLAVQQDNDEHNLNITPKERLVRKKEVERNRRELELQLANIGFHKERQEVQKRKQTMLASSALQSILAHNGGHMGQQQHHTAYTPAGQPVSHSGTAGAYHMAAGDSQAWDSTMVNLGTMPTQQQPFSGNYSHGNPNAPATPTAQRGYNPDNSLVNFDTMPNQQQSATAAHEDTTGSSRGAYPEYPWFEDGPGHNIGLGHASRGARPFTADGGGVHAGSPMYPQAGVNTGGGHGGNYSDLGDTVLMGTVTSGRPITAPVSHRPDDSHHQRLLGALVNTDPSRSPADNSRQPAYSGTPTSVNHAFNYDQQRSSAQSWGGTPSSNPMLPSHFGGATPTKPGGGLPPHLGRGLTSDMRSISTPPLQHQQQQPRASAPGSNGKPYGATANHIQDGQRAYKSESGASAAPPTGGFKFGLDTLDRNCAPLPPTSPFSLPEAHTPTKFDGVRQSPLGLVPGCVRFGMRSESKPKGCFDYVIHTQDELNSGPLDSPRNSHPGGNPAQQGAPALPRQQRQTRESDEYEEDFEEYSEDKYEDYSGSDVDSEMADLKDEVRTRSRIVNTVMNLSMSLSDGLSTENLTGVMDVSVTCNRAEKAAAVRTRCRQALGTAFDPVYKYLKIVRGRGADEQPDERDVQRDLLELVHGDRSLLQGCFMCDQLVFQEMMYGGSGGGGGGGHRHAMQYVEDL